MNLRYRNINTVDIDVQFMHIEGIYMYLFPSHIFEEAAKPGRNCSKKH